MINAAKSAAGSASSLIKDPTASIRSALSGHLTTLGNYSKIPEISSLSSSLSSLSSNVASSVSSKLANLHHDLPVASAGTAINSKVQLLEGQGSGPPPDASAAFSSITQGPGILQGAHDQVSGLVSQLPDPSTIPDPQIAVTSTDSNGNTTTIMQDNPQYTTWKSNNPALFTSISSVTSATSSAHDSFSSALSTESTAMQGHLDTIKGFSLASMIANPAAAIAGVLNSVVDTSKIQSSAMDVLKFKNAVPRASLSSMGLGADTSQAYENRVPPSDTTLSTLKANRDSAKVTLNTAQNQLLSDISARDAYAKSIGYYQAQADATDNPGDVTKQTTFSDKAKLMVAFDATQTGRQQYETAQDAYDKAEEAYMNALRRV